MNLNELKSCYKKATQEQKTEMIADFLRNFPISMKQAENQFSAFYIDEFCNLLIDFPELIALDRFKLFKQDYIRCGYVVPGVMYAVLTYAEPETEETPSIH